MNNKILLIDKERDLVDVLTYFLTIEGFEVIPLSYTDNIITLLDECHPDLIIIDHIFYEKEGQLCRQIKDNPKHSHLPVIIFSASCDSETAFAYGCDVFISKPFDLQNLIEQITFLLPTKVLVSY
jgi:two-component system alkaline phosphatase synthesis response regulator PhoP